jgi:hypothetical protein
MAENWDSWKASMRDQDHGWIMDPIHDKIDDLLLYAVYPGDTSKGVFVSVTTVGKHSENFVLNTGCYEFGIPHIGEAVFRSKKVHNASSFDELATYAYDHLRIQVMGKYRGVHDNWEIYCDEPGENYGKVLHRIAAKSRIHAEQIARDMVKVKFGVVRCGSTTVGSVSPSNNFQATPASVVLTKESILSRMDADNDYMLDCLMMIWSQQTSDEQQDKHTKHVNGCGFTGFDSELLSSYAQYVQMFRDGRSRYPTPLGKKQMAIARHRMKKYAGQILRISGQ